MFVFVYSSYHLKLSFPHLVVTLTTLKTPKNTFCFNNNIMQNDNVAGIRGHYHKSSDCFEYPKKSPLKSSHPKKYLPNFPTRKNPGIKNFKPKKSFDHPHHLKSGVPPLRLMHEKFNYTQFTGMEYVLQECTLNLFSHNVS